MSRTVEVVFGSQPNFTVLKGCAWIVHCWRWAAVTFESNPRLLANFSAEKQAQLPLNMRRNLFSWIFEGFPGSAANDFSSWGHHDIAYKYTLMWRGRGTPNFRAQRLQQRLSRLLALHQKSLVILFNLFKTQYTLVKGHWLANKFEKINIYEAFVRGARPLFAENIPVYLHNLHKLLWRHITRFVCFS